MNIIYKHFGLIIVLILSFWAINQLFIPGFFPIHDDTQVARVYEMGKSLRDGMFPVRWVSDLGYGYGYPLFNFYAPLAYYIGGSLLLLGFDALIATKIMMAVGILLAGIFMYFLAREFWGEIGGIVSGLFYVYAPYHAVDIYVRGDVAEFWAYAFIPLVFYGLWKTYMEQKWRHVVIGSIGYAGLILSHNLTAMMVTPFLIIVTLFYYFIAYRKKNVSTIYYLLSIICLGLLLSTFYWLPALLEMKYTNIMSQIGGGADFRDHFVCISQLWESDWRFGGSTLGCIDGLSFKTGKLHIVLALLSFSLFFKKTNVDNTRKLVLILFFAFTILSILIMVSFSKPIWEFVKPMEFIQYPWRFLILTSFFTSFLGGSIALITKIYLSENKHINTIVYISAGALVFFLIYFNTKLFVPQTIFQAKSSDFTNELTLKWKTSKTSDEYMPKDFIKPKNETEIVKNKLTIESGMGKIESVEEKAQQIKANLIISKSATVLIHLANFPSWKVYSNEKDIFYFDSHRGFLVFLPIGEHKLTVKFQETLVEQIGNVISLAGISLLIVGIMYSTRRRIW